MAAHSRKLAAESATVRVPATTANLGPGFDCLGIALKLYNRVTVCPAKEVPDDAMLAEAGAAFFKGSKRSGHGFACKVEGEVPRSRGLGSSVTVRLGVLMGLNALHGSPLSRQQLFEICAALEGHPDNAAPAVFGGFCAAAETRALFRCTVPASLRFVLLVPDAPMETKAARKVLPATIPLAEAAKNAAHCALITAAFASKQFDQLSGCFEDFLHQPYRAAILPGMEDVFRAAAKAGATGAWLSGSGSTMAAMTSDDPQRVVRAMGRAFGRHPARTITLVADNSGARVLRLR